MKWGNNILNIHQDGYIRCLALTILMIEELQAHLLQPQVLARCQNPFRSSKTAQCRNHPGQTSSRRTSSENKKAQERWTKDEEKLLVRLWAEKHDQLESRECRKTWAWIAEKISKALQSNKTADKCIRKMKYIIERYKNAKDWNKNQTGGNLRKSVYYDEVDKILGCHDLVTFNNVAEAGISGKSAPQVVAESSDTTGKNSTSSSPNVLQTPAEKRRASKKGKRASKRKAPDNDSDEEFKMALKDMRQQGEKVTAFMDSLQQSQTQQLAMMNQFMGSIVKILGQQNEKDN